jgi:hypothetical protein
MLIIQSKGEELITISLYDEILAKLENENKSLREMI